MGLCLKLQGLMDEPVPVDARGFGGAQVETIGISAIGGESGG